MKNNIKLFVGILIGIVICGISVYAAEEIINAKDIRYKTKTVEDSLNELYIKANAKDVGAVKFCKFIDGTYGSFGEIGSKYECDPGDGVKRNFYILKENPESVELISEKNITNNLTYANAIKYFDIHTDGIRIKNEWTNVVKVGIPIGKDLAKAAGNDNYINGAYQFGSTYKWLYNYLAGCSSYGCDSSTDTSTEEKSYILEGSSNYAGYSLVVDWTGEIGTNNLNNSTFCVRPVITILKSNLYSE